jgi:hypothetical protein
MGEVRGGRGANAASRMRDPEIGACLRQYYEVVSPSL